MSADPEDFDDDINAEPIGPATQIGLMCAILTYLAKTTGGHGIDLYTSVGIDVANAVLAAANSVLAELRKPPELESDTCGQHLLDPADAGFIPPRRPKV